MIIEDFDDDDDFAVPSEEELAGQGSDDAERRGKVFTFYSFKGGVGRSMAMANIAVLAARAGKKVLVVDFDLEAPGLEHFFHKHDPALAGKLKETPGLVDLLKVERPHWSDCVHTIHLRDEEIDILHSGKASRSNLEYTRDVQEINWGKLYEKQINIGGVFVQIKKEWLDVYDYVFIDSRTGVTDSSDLCTVILPDHLVMLFVTNEQNISGIAGIFRRAVREHGRMPLERSRLTVLPVLSRDEFYSEYDKATEWRNRAAEELGDLFADWLPSDLSPLEAFQKIFIPYFAIWSFGEALPVVDRPEETSNPASISAAYFRIAQLILNDFDWSILDRMADPGETAGVRAAQKEELERDRERQTAELEAERARMAEEIAKEREAQENRLRAAEVEQKARVDALMAREAEQRAAYEKALANENNARKTRTRVYNVLALLLLIGAAWVTYQSIQTAKIAEAARDVAIAERDLARENVDQSVAEVRRKMGEALRAAEADAVRSAKEIVALRNSMSERIASLEQNLEAKAEECQQFATERDQARAQLGSATTIARALVGTAPESCKAPLQEVISVVSQDPGNAKVRNFLRTFNRQNSCFFARAQTLGVQSAELEAFSSDPKPAVILNGEFKSTFGYEASIGLRRISKHQCDLIEFLARQTETRFAGDIFLRSAAFVAASERIAVETNSTRTFTVELPGLVVTLESDGRIGSISEVGFPGTAFMPSKVAGPLLILVIVNEDGRAVPYSRSTFASLKGLIDWLDENPELRFEVGFSRIEAK